MDYRFFLLAFFLFVSNAVEAATGFGATIIALTLAVHFYPIAFLVPLIIPLNLIVSTYIATRHRKAIDLKLLFTRIVPLVSLGLPVGMAIFHYTDAEKLKFIFGVFVFLLAASELSRSLRTDLSNNKPLAGPIGAAWLLAGGVIHGLYASGGPLIVYYASRNLKNKSNFRATLSGLWAIMSAFLFAGHLYSGSITAETAETGLKILPVVIVGIVAGEYLHKILPEKIFRVFVYAILLFAGVSIILVG